MAKKRKVFAQLKLVFTDGKTTWPGLMNVFSKADLKNVLENTTDPSSGVKSVTVVYK